MPKDARPPTAGLLERGRDIQEGGRKIGEGVRRKDDPVSDDLRAYARPGKDDSGRAD